MFIMCKMADDNCDLWLLDLDLKGQNWKTQAAEMVYTTTQRLKILKGSARTQTDKKSSQINKWRVQAFHIIPNEEFYSGWFLNLHHNSVIIVVQDDAFPFCVTFPVCAWNKCPVSCWVELLSCLLAWPEYQVTATAPSLFVTHCNSDDARNIPQQSNNMFLFHKKIARLATLCQVPAQKIKQIAFICLNYYMF